MNKYNNLIKKKQDKTAGDTFLSKLKRIDELLQPQYQKTGDLKPGDHVKLINFEGTKISYTRVSPEENYWRLIEEEGIIISCSDENQLIENKVCVRLKTNLKAWNLVSHNTVPNTLWIHISDLEKNIQNPENLQKAYPLLKELLEKDNLQGDNDKILKVYNNFLYVCFYLKKYEEGISLFENIEKTAWKNAFIFHHAACLYTKKKDHSKAIEQVRKAYLYNYENRQDLLIDEDLQELHVYDEFMNIFKNEGAGNKIKSLIIGYIKKGICKRKNEKCSVSGEKIEKGREVLEIKFYFGDFGVYILPQYLQQAEFYNSYQNKYLKNAYSPKDFDVYGFFWHPMLFAVIRDFSFEKALNILNNPPFESSPYYYQTKDNNICNPDFKVELGSKYNLCHDEIFSLISVLIRCGYKEKLLQRMEKMPAYVLPLLAMLDDRDFQDKAAKVLEIPKLPEIYETLRKPKHKLEDMLAMITFGTENKGFLEILAKTIEIYEPHLSNSIGYNNDFLDFTNVRNGHLIYLFISEPQLFPIFHRLLTKTQFPTSLHGEYTYIKCYHYRAAVFYELLHYPQALQTRLDTMEDQVKYFQAGSPKGFINDTKKMVNQYLKKK